MERLRRSIAAALVAFTAAVILVTALATSPSRATAPSPTLAPEPPSGASDGASNEDLAPPPGEGEQLAPGEDLAPAPTGTEGGGAAPGVTTGGSHEGGGQGTAESGPLTGGGLASRLERIEESDESIPHPRRAAHLRGIPFGVGDQNPSMLTDPRFVWLGVRSARLMVPWDVARHAYEMQQARTWLLEARKRGVQPLVAFDKSLVHPARLPSVTAYAHAVRKFRHAFPWIRRYQTWNEENQGDEPTHRNPARAAAYFNWFSHHCRHCSVTAADMLDGPSMESWLHRFLRHARRPRLWGLHPYYELTYGGDHDLSLLTKLAHGHVWLTEAGTPLWHFVREEKRFRYNKAATQARAARRLLAMVGQHRRISRVYFYQWRSETSVRASKAQLARHRRVTVTWDSGLLNPDCGLRPAFGVLAKALGRRPARAPHTRRSHNGEECLLVEKRR